MVALRGLVQMFDSHSDSIQALLVSVKPKEGGNTGTIKKFHFNTSVSIKKAFAETIFVGLVCDICVVNLAKKTGKDE